MRVLYFHQYFQTPKGASGTRSYDMAQALITAGYDVTMICGSVVKGNTGLNHPFVNGYRQGIVDDIDVIEFDLAYSNHMNYGERIKVFIKYILSSIRVVLREPTDIVFATSTPLTIGIIGIFARWFKKKPFIFEVRDLWPELPRAMGIVKNPLVLWLMNCLEWVSYKSANRLIALSPGIVKGITAKGVDVKKIEMISNGSNLNFFSEDISFNRPEGLGHNDLIAIFTGAHGVANGLDAVLDAASVIKKKDKQNIKIIFIGEGKLKLILKERAKREKLDNVIFLNSMPKPQLIGIMNNADIGLQILENVPSFYNGTSPNKFFDYIACGLPVLNNYPGWLADLIEKHQCGYVVDPNNPELFADKLIHAAENRDKLKQMGINSRNLAIKEFDIKILGKKFVKCFEDFKK
jgi:glycosyltransferase involved in cell wall biosynthesis